MSFGDIIAGATAVLRDMAGVAVEYRRGPKTATLTLIPARWADEQNADAKAKVAASQGDWLALTADLLFDEVAFEPQKGDRFTATLDGKLVTWEVHPTKGEPCWRFADRYRKRIRLHAVTVGTTDAD